MVLDLLRYDGLGFIEIDGLGFIEIDGLGFIEIDGLGFIEIDGPGFAIQDPSLRICNPLYHLSYIDNLVDVDE